MNQVLGAINDPASLDELCNGNWCWLSSQDLPFESITVKGGSDDTIRDVVSNSGNWFTCNDSTIGDLRSS